MPERRSFLRQSAIASASLMVGRYPADALTAGISPALAAKIAADPQRPRYHFLPLAHWMNDPNGPIFWQGYYHLFYQYNPRGPFWGDMHWGHARSRDLVHWTHLPVALAPTPGGPDKEGCFSGSSFSNRGTVWLIYTGVQPEVQCLASGGQSLIHWQKFKGNPVLAAPPRGFHATGFRDPSVWREGAVWRMTVGSGVKGQGGAVLLYESYDLIHWNYLHELASGPPFLTTGGGDMWECPDFFPLDRAHVLLVSTQGAVYSMTGSYLSQKFQPEHHAKADNGNGYYAAKSFADASGRRILWGWIREGRSEAAQRAAGWAGVMSLPRILTLDQNGNLCTNPAPELQMLREPLASLENVVVRGNLPVHNIRHGCLEIDVDVALGNAEQFGLAVRQSPNLEEETIIAFNPSTRRLTLDMRRSSLDPATARGIFEALIGVQDTRPVHLSVFLDNSVIELFADRNICLTGRIYPTRRDSVGLSLFSKGGKTVVKKLQVYSMRSIWE